MLRIHFTERDLGQVSIAREPDPLWETVLGTFHISAPHRAMAGHRAWRDEAVGELQERRLGRAWTLLRTLVNPQIGYFPDFLTPTEAASGLEAGLQALRATPLHRLRHDIDFAEKRSKFPLPAWCHELANGDRERLEELTEAVRLVHQAIVAPRWTEITRKVDADRAHRLRALRDGGVQGLLASFRPRMSWREPVLEGPYPTERDIHLGGRGLRLIPSYFCDIAPVSFADPALPPTAVYPVEHELSWVPDLTPAGHGDALCSVLGRTRAKVLSCLDGAVTTSEVAKQLGIAQATASEHVACLRQAGLATSRQEGPYNIHTLTALGAALLLGELPPD